MNLDDRWASYWESVRKAMQLGKYDHAEPLLYAALDIAEDFKPDDKRLVMTLECLAEILFKMDRPVQAEPVVKRIIMIYQRKHGPDHPDIAVFTNNLALLYHNQKKHFMAETEYQKALSMQTKLLGSTHPQTLNVMANYARLLTETHRQREAKHLIACIRGAQTGSWKQSGVFKAYVAEPQESVIQAPVEDITLQDIALVPVITGKAEGLEASTESQNQLNLLSASRPAAAPNSMMQKLVEQRKKVE